jgi:siroheme decarboxylase
MTAGVERTFRRSRTIAPMDEKDRLLLTYLQKGLPLTSRPFNVLSAKIGADSAELLVRIQRLKKEGIFTGAKAILNPRAFYYQSAWVAVRIGQKHHLSPSATSTSCGDLEVSNRSQASAEAVPKDQPLAQFNSEDLESLAEVFWRHPGVAYGCERDHEFNLWFFIAVPAGYDLELHVRCLEKLAGVRRALFLPVRKVFKGADLLSSLDAETFPATTEHFEKRQVPEISDLTIEEIEMIRRLQEPFPLTDEPYQKIAADLGITEGQALERIKTLEKKGCLKRIGSFLKPAGFLSNTSILVVWQIPEEKLERIGSEIAGFNEVLYADRRPAFTEFPYTFYTTIQASTSAELEVLVRRMQDRIGKWPYRVLVTTRELKKGPIKYFPKELEGWWRGNRHVAETAFH